MAKSKNHTNHNQNRKAHRNGIKKPQRHREISSKGMDQKFVLNQRYATKANKIHPPRPNNIAKKTIIKKKTVGKDGKAVEHKKAPRKFRSFLNKGWGRDLVCLERSIRAEIPYQEQYRRMNQSAAARKLNQLTIRKISAIAKHKVEKRIKNARARKAEGKPAVVRKPKAKVQKKVHKKAEAPKQ